MSSEISTSHLISCSKCGNLRSLSEFRNPIKALTARSSMCIYCEREMDRNWYLKKKEAGTVWRKPLKMPKGAIAKRCKKCGKSLHVMPYSEFITCKCGEKFGVSTIEDEGKLKVNLWYIKGVQDHYDEVLGFVKTRKTFIHEIMRELNLTYEMVKREIVKLESEGLILIDKRSQTHYISYRG